MGGKGGSGVTADAKKCGPGKVDHPHIAKLQVEAEANHRIKQHGAQQQQRKMNVIKSHGKHQDTHCAANAEQARRCVGRCAQRLGPVQLAQAHHGNHDHYQQRTNRELAFCMQQGPQIDEYGSDGREQDHF